MCSGWRNPITDHHPLLTARKEGMSSIDKFPHAVTPPWWVRHTTPFLLTLTALGLGALLWWGAVGDAPVQPVGDTQTHVLLATISTELTMLHITVHELRLVCGQEGR